jgi:imidazolonepropionase
VSLSGEQPVRLLIRNLAQVASPAGTTSPLRGAALRSIELIEDAYIVCEGGRIGAVGTMRRLGSLADDVVEVDGRGLSAVPGLVDCHTHACFAGDRVDEFSLRAGGATYEELHAKGGGILSTVRATRAAWAYLQLSLDIERGCCERVRRPSRPSRDTGSTARPSLRNCA